MSSPAPPQMPISAPLPRRPLCDTRSCRCWRFCLRRAVACDLIRAAASVFRVSGTRILNCFSQQVVVQVAVFNGISRITSELSPHAPAEASGRSADDAAAAAVEHSAVQDSENSQRDWMHRLRPGDIVLVSASVQVLPPGAFPCHVARAAASRFSLKMISRRCFLSHLITIFCLSPFQIQLQRSEAIKGAIPDAVRCCPFSIPPPACVLPSSHQHSA